VHWIMGKGERSIPAEHAEYAADSEIMARRWGQEDRGLERSSRNKGDVGGTVDETPSG